MEVINGTTMVAGYTMGVSPSGRESLVVVVKGTFSIPPHPNQIPQLTTKQLPLIAADTFSGDPGFSATVYESDYAPFKPSCDVLLNGSAYSPRSKPDTEVDVSMKVGRVNKSFRVVGNRVWLPGLLSPRPSPPEAFTVMPISYDNAFGGIDNSHEKSSKHDAYRPNLVGVGFHVNLNATEGKPLPNTEQMKEPVLSPTGKYRPMAFGAVARACEPRLSYAGTYDEEWMKNEFPFLPADFDDRYYQSAAEDQQTDYLKGGEEVELLNLTPSGTCRFSLPTCSVPVEFNRRDGTSETIDARLDTVLLEPDRGTFSLCWRASLPLRKNIFEIPTAIVGRMPNGWYRARATGKDYFPSLQHFVSRQQVQEGE